MYNVHAWYNKQNFIFVVRDFNARPRRHRKICLGYAGEWRGCILYIAVQAQHCKEPEGVYDQLVAPELPAVCGAW